MKPLLLLARHGETEANEKNMFHSWMNDELTEKGIHEAHEAADFLHKHFSPTMIVASPLHRAINTALIAGHRLGLQPEKDSRLIGWGMGPAFTGKVRTPHLERMRDFYLGHPERQPPGGESILTQEHRFGEILEKGLAYGRKGGLALFETHGSGIKAAHTILTGQRDIHGDAALVHGGGIAAVYANRNKFELWPIFKEASARAAVS